MMGTFSFDRMRSSAPHIAAATNHEAGPGQGKTPNESQQQTAFGISIEPTAARPAAGAVVTTLRTQAPNPRHAAGDRLENARAIASATAVRTTARNRCL